MNTNLIAYVDVSPPLPGGWINHANYPHDMHITVRFHRDQVPARNPANFAHLFLIGRVQNNVLTFQCVTSHSTHPHGIDGKYLPGSCEVGD